MSGAQASAELVLGTAQLGMAYGAANRRGQPSEEEARLLLRSALSAGIRWIDTAAAYGCSEQRIGAALCSSLGARIATKLEPFDGMDERAAAGAVRQSVTDCVRRSLARLRTDRLDALLLHRPQHRTFADGAVWNALKELRNEGAIFDLGVSVYTPHEALAALSDPDVRHLQLPFNVLDWRWRSSGVIQALRRRSDVTVHARSALLQGLLAAEPDARWPRIEGVDAHALVAALERLARDLRRDGPADLCLAYVRAQDWIDGVVVGMESLTQLALNLALFKRPVLTAAEIAAVDAALPRASERLLDPSRWAAAA